MKLTETTLIGAFLIDLEPRPDARGFFARTWCEHEFAELGLHIRWVQCNISFNRERGTLRGMHYQAAPYAEAKLIRCTMGAIYDVIIDLRPDSSTFKRWVAAELTADNRRLLYVPEGFGHGFQTLVDGTEVFYQMSQVYAPDYGRGIRWDDPAFEISWPVEKPIISERDRGFPDFIS
jgi:dTDP-4-dehydrorhamnose 3,5-epimerase